MASWRIKESGLTPIVGDLVWTAADNRSRSCVDKEKEVGMNAVVLCESTRNFRVSVFLTTGFDKYVCN